MALFQTRLPKDTVLIRICTITLVVFLPYLFIGCVQTLEGVSTSKEEYYLVQPAKESDGSDATGAAGKEKNIITDKEAIKSEKKSRADGIPIASLPSEQELQPADRQRLVPPDTKPSRIKETTIPQTAPTPGDKKTETQGALTPQKIQLILDEALDFCQAAQDFWQKGELESAIEALDQAYLLILYIDAEDTQPELLQQKEDLRFTISKRILEIYASRNIVVNGAHNEIPIILNHHTMAEVKLFTTGREKAFFQASYQRSGMYRPEILAALREAGLPAELSWLPLIESGFKVNALSRARALGLCQFIPSTGYKFGLKRNYYVDERLDPTKATRAAIDYLKELHSMFGDWTTVLAGYNCGEGRVLRVIRNQKVNYLDDFWDLYKRLPRETARYVPRFLATLHILQNPEKYGLNHVELDAPIPYETVTISRSIHLRDIAKQIGVSEKTMKRLNPELRYNIVPPETYSLRVPNGKKSILLARLDNIPVTSKPRQAYGRHRVRRGETLSTISKKYRVSINAIMRANNIHRKNYIVAGQSLKIPQKGTIVYKTQKYKKPTVAFAATHVVRSGDSLWNIAKKYGATVKQIQKKNRLRNNRLQIGQVLKIPRPAVQTATGEGLKTYQVRRGDSPFRIAKKNNMSLERFLRINRLTPRSKIYPGQLLMIE